MSLGVSVSREMSLAVEKTDCLMYHRRMTPVAENKATSWRAGTAPRLDSGSHSTRPTIGYLALRTGDNVSQALWMGVVDGARERGANLICFSGDRLCGPDGASSPANVLYDLVSSEVVDGLVSWASSVGGSLEHDEIVRFHRRYRPLPMVSITLPMEGCPTVLIDSYAGMRDVVAHLIESHGCHRLAFIHGSESHYYAQERYRAYVDTLAAYDIPLNPNLVTEYGDFVPSTGLEGIRLLLDERELQPTIDFDAVVTVSDLPALGALEELQARGIRVPEDVALVGFNDGREGRFVTPPLTSVRLPFYEQGRKAVEMLMAQLAGERVPEQVVLPAKLKVRQSCGCVLPSVVQAAAKLPQAPVLAGGTFEAALAARREVILDAMVQAAESSADGLGLGWAARLLDAFAAEVSEDSEVAGAFLQELDHLLRRVVTANGQVASWQNVVSALRCHLLPVLGDVGAGALRRANDLWAQAWVLIGEVAQRARGYQMVQGTYQTQALRQISRELVATFDVTELADVLARELPQLGIERCYLALYENPQKPTERSRLILAYDERGRVELDVGEQVFSSGKLAPIDLLAWHRSDRPYSLVVESLHFREEQIGFVLFEVGPRDGTIYEVLSRQISSSLKGALLFDETRKAQTAAEKADRLKTRLLANVSHELRAPLNVIIGCTREILNPPASYDAVLPEVLLDDLRHIGRSAEHQLRVINDLLDLSRAEIDELDLYLELLDPRLFLEEVFHSMSEANSLDDVVWHLQLPDRLPTIQADPVRLRQILLNLLSNASKFVERGQVVLGAEVAPPNLHIWVQDTGPGIPVDMHERIFEPFVTAGHANRRLEGAGLGLSITRRLVALHRGSMRLESQPGQGSTFHIYLPLPTLSDRPSASSSAVQPVLLLISSHDQPALDVVEFSQRQGLEILQLQASDDLDAVIQRVQPAALAWDLVGAGSGDWVIIRRLRNHPKLSQVPFILYGQESKEGTVLRVGMTNFVVKSVDGDTLMEAIDSLCPPDVGPILIVDDDPAVLDLYQEVVTRGCPKYPIRTAADGAAALTCMAEDTPSLVILDLMMPGMDGFDVLDWMRANDRTRQVPVLVVSSRLLNRDDANRLEQHARVAFQSKGILSEEELIASLHRVLFGVDTLPRHTSALVKRAVAYFHQNYDHALSRWEVAEAVGVSESYLSRVFRQELGISLWDYLNRYRILQAKRLLRRKSDSIKTIAPRVGFKDPAYFSRVFHKLTGLSPTAYREHPETA
jgi:signal transduction histidine kinase/DNA-binding LacI/PurR family transcriptional regulator/AraC-like DNA-binding protein/DNA-binding response OmpR family regulator